MDIRTAVSQELASDPHVDTDDIVVEVTYGGVAMTRAVPAGVRATARQGVISLTGLVSNGAQRAAAHDAVAGVAGVLSITDQIEVQGDT